MGEAKANKYKHAQMRSGEMTCVYCGTRPSTTVDHMPPRMAFNGKQRPNVFAFPCCDQCNSITADNDTIISWFARIYAGEDQEAVTPEFEKLSKEMGRFTEITHELRYRGRIGHVRNAAGIIVPSDLVTVTMGPNGAAALRQFALKYTLAMHWHATGQIVAEDTPIWIYATTNYHIMTNPVVRQLLGSFRGLEIMRQGSMTSEGQFSFQNVASAEFHQTVHLGVFRQSFAVCGFVNASPNPAMPPENVMRRADLQRPYPYQ